MSEHNHHKSFLENLRVDLIFVVMGFCAMVGQVLLLRRFMAVFSGNELVVGAVLFGWVFWAGLGNLLAGHVADRIRDIPRLLSLLLNLTAIFLPLTIIAAYLSKLGMGYPPSQLVGLPIVTGITITLLAPFCFLVGASLTIAAKLPATGRAKDIGVLYLFDALGAGLGGIVATWIALRAFTTFQVALMTAIILTFFNGAILVRKKSTQVLTALIAILGVAILWLAPGIELWTTKQVWKGYNPIVNIESRFGNLVVTEQGDEHTLFADGSPQFSTPLPETYENEAMLPLMMNPDPKDVLLIGGGLSGMLANWRNLPLESITYIQVDKDVTRLEKDFMVPPEAMQDGRLDIKFQDAVSYLRELDHKGCHEKCFDIIILSSGDPDTASSSRLLTESFFRHAKKALRSDGVLSFGVFQPGNAIGPEAEQLLGTIQATVKSEFDHDVILPFDRFYFLMSSYGSYLTDDPEIIRSRLVERNIVAPVLEGQYISSIFPERIKIARAIIDGAARSAPKNTDTRPAAYFNGLLLWASRTGGAALKALQTLREIRWYWLAGTLGLLAIILLLSCMGHKHRALRASSFWTLFSVGFCTIIYEIALLVYYQLKFGLLFYRIGIIITAFMVGLSIGAYLSIRIFQRIKIRTAYLLIGLMLLAIYQPLLFRVTEFSFILANLGCGLIGGFLFEGSAEWMVAEHEKIGHTAGWLNCADYWGSAIGSILASIITIPLFGLNSSLYIAAALPISAGIVVTASRLMKT